jgi:transposase-like protein
MPPLKSNQGIVEELERLTEYLAVTKAIPACPDSSCANHNIPVGTKKAYRSFGTTKAGAKRFQCSICSKTFSIAKSTQYQHDTHHNIDIFKMLMNKVPLSRIINMLGISWEVLYNRIDFIHKQCLAFVANRENELKTLPIDRLYLAIDRQDHTVNWSDRKDKRNITLSAVCSSDNKTSYVFGIHPNFDYKIDKEAIEADAVAIQDGLKSEPLKKYARLWLEADYEKSLAKKIKGKDRLCSNDLNKSIQSTYDNAAQREDIEAFDEKTYIEKLPSYGLQIKAEYTMIAHLYFIKNLCGNVEKWRFFMDQEPGIRSACLTAFKDEIKARNAEAFYVSIEKELTVDEKRQFKAKAKKRFIEIKEANPLLSDEEIKLEMLKEEIKRVSELGKFKDRWVQHPLPSMSEANKAMCWLTEHDDYDLTHKAWLYNKASLHSVDSFFEKIRRRIAMLERPIHSAANSGRTWNGYGAYNPAMVIKMLEIFRVVHNYIDIRKEDKKTPAMRLGLAKAPLSYKNVLYFK